jgi:hypothetical protein
MGYVNIITTTTTTIIIIRNIIIWARASIAVKALCYKRKVAGSIPDEVNF